MKKVAIVILNWNGAAMLKRFLPTVVERSGSRAEVVVADNASGDDSLELLKSDFPSVRIIELDRNYGFAEGYNRALQQVSADYYVLLNSDVEVTEGWADSLLAFMETHPEVAACQPKLLAAYDHSQFEYAGASGGFLDRYGYPFCRGRVFDTVERDHGQYDDECEVMWATGACLMIRRTDYWQAGGLDGRFFAHNEEIDLCWRLNIMGRKVFCVPKSKVFHVGGGTLPKGNPMKTYLNFRNNLTMLYKNLPEAELRRVMRMRLWLDWLAAVKSLVLDGNVGEFKAIVRARRAYHAWRKDFDGDRAKIQASRLSQADPMRKPYSILWQYYVRGKKTFESE